MKTTIQLDDHLRDELMILKVKAKAKNIEEVLRRAIKLLKKHGFK